MPSRRGAPIKLIDLAELEKLGGLQATNREIAAWFGISEQTLNNRLKNKTFRETLERGKDKGLVSLRRKLFALADRSAAAAIFLSKNLLGYKDVQVLDGNLTHHNADIDGDLDSLIKQRLANVASGGEVPGEMAAAGPRKSAHPTVQ
jgi:hypothetical protein